MYNDLEISGIEVTGVAEYRIAVCDDDPVLREHLIHLCGSLLSEWGISHALTPFSAAAQLRDVLEREPASFDLLLLDIQMAGMSGMELARGLRAQGNQVPLVFITSHPDYALEGYEVHPVHYLLKPVEREALARALRMALDAPGRPRPVVLRTAGKTLSLTEEDIWYVEIRNHSAHIFLDQESVTVPMSLAEVERLLPRPRFARCHNSFLVNLAYVREVRRTELLLRNGSRLPVGRRFYQSFQSAFIDFLTQ